MTPTITQTTPVEEKPVEFSIGHRQMAAIGFVAFLLLGLVATFSYLAGRITSTPGGAPVKSASAVSPKPAAAVPATSANSSKRSDVEKSIVVDAPPAAAPAAATSTVSAAIVPPTTTVPAPAPVAVPAAAAPASKPVYEPTPMDKLKGNTYLQVAAVDRGMAEVTSELLIKRGLPAFIGDSPSEGVFRVLVGPIQDPAEAARHQAVLGEAGFKPFLKKYF